MNKKMPEIFDNSNAYFSYFEDQCERLEKIGGHFELIEEIRDICENIKKKIDLINSRSFFVDISEILGYDARLQIIVQLLDIAGEIELMDIEIINLERQDYSTFVKELCGYHLDDIPPHSLYFSVS